MIRRVDTWTVLRFSLLFYVSMLVVVVVAGVLLWAAAATVGVVGNVEKFIKELFALESFHLSPVKILEGTVIGGMVLVLLGTGANVVMALIYNLTSDVVGGVEVTVVEEDPAVRRPMV